MKAMRERDIKAAQSGQNAKENLGINSDDDEDDAEWKARCAKLHPTPYKWTDEGESLLEECLIKVAFDFGSLLLLFLIILYVPYEVGFVDRSASSVVFVDLFILAWFVVDMAASRVGNKKLQNDRS